MPNPLDTAMWQDIRDAYDIVQSGKAEEVEVESVTTLIIVEQTSRTVITIEVREK